MRASISYVPELGVAHRVRNTSLLVLLLGISVAY